MKRSKYIIFISIILLQAVLQVSAQTPAPIKVACIGNSITYGYGLDANEEERKKKSYPVKLQALLGTDYKVTNYGVSGTTMLKDPNDGGSLDDKQWSYWESMSGPGDGGKEQYDLALQSIPDIVIIKFGTNDARGENWRSSPSYGSLQGYGKNNFYNHYTEFISSFRTVNPKVIIYICYSLPSLRNDEQARVIREEVIPTIKQVARKNNVHLVDLHSEFYQGAAEGLIMGSPDLIHPTEAGAELIAKEVFKMIKMTYNP